MLWSLLRVTMFPPWNSVAQPVPLTWVLSHGYRPWRERTSTAVTCPNCGVSVHLDDLPKLVADEHEPGKYLRKLRTLLVGKHAETCCARQGRQVLPDDRLRGLQTLDSSGASARPCSPAVDVTTRIANGVRMLQSRYASLAHAPDALCDTVNRGVGNCSPLARFSGTVKLTYYLAPTDAQRLVTSCLKFDNLDSERFRMNARVVMRSKLRHPETDLHASGGRHSPTVHPSGNEACNSRSTLFNSGSISPRLLLNTRVDRTRFAARSANVENITGGHTDIRKS